MEKKKNQTNFIVFLIFEEKKSDYETIVSHVQLKENFLRNFRHSVGGEEEHSRKNVSVID